MKMIIFNMNIPKVTLVTNKLKLKKVKTILEVMIIFQVLLISRFRIIIITISILLKLI
jgi:hypothetical protein